VHRRDVARVVRQRESVPKVAALGFDELHVAKVVGEALGVHVGHGDDLLRRTDLVRLLHVRDEVLDHLVRALLAGVQQPGHAHRIRRRQVQLHALLCQKLDGTVLSRRHQLVRQRVTLLVHRVQHVFVPLDVTEEGLLVLVLVHRTRRQRAQEILFFVRVR
jgi:hypothetical protein